MTVNELGGAVSWLDGEVGTPLIEMTVDLRMNRAYGEREAPDVDDVVATVRFDDRGGGRNYQRFTWVYADAPTEDQVRVRGHGRRLPGRRLPGREEAPAAGVGSEESSVAPDSPVPNSPAHDSLAPVEEHKKSSLAPNSQEASPSKDGERLPSADAADAEVPAACATMTEGAEVPIAAKCLEADDAGVAAESLAQIDVAPTEVGRSRRLWGWVVAVVLALAGAGVVWMLVGARAAPFRRLCSQAGDEMGSRSCRSPPLQGDVQRRAGDLTVTPCGSVRDRPQRRRRGSVRDRPQRRGTGHNGELRGNVT